MDHIEQVFKPGYQRIYPSGQIMLYQGEKSSSVYYIHSGYIKVYDITVRGEEKVLLILGKGDLFPLIWTFGASDSLLYFYEVHEEVELSVLPRDSFIEHIQKDHQFTIALLEYFVDRTKELMTRVESIEGTSALHKVGQVLLYLANTHGQKLAKDAQLIKLTITHQLLAQMAGITRETVSIQMKIFEENEAIEKNEANLIIHTDRIEEILSTEKK